MLRTGCDSFNGALRQRSPLPSGDALCQRLSARELPDRSCSDNAGQHLDKNQPGAHVAVTARQQPPGRWKSVGKAIGSTVATIQAEMLRASRDQPRALVLPRVVACVASQQTSNRGQKGVIAGETCVSVMQHERLSSSTLAEARRARLLTVRRSRSG